MSKKGKFVIPSYGLEFIHRKIEAFTRLKKVSYRLTMAGEGSIEQQDLQQILDNLVKEEEEGNGNVSTTTTTITIWDNISNALDE